MPEPMTRDKARAEYLRTLAKLDGVDVPRVLVQPDDPGIYARTCLRCGLDEGLGAMRLCARCCPPAPWWAHLCRWLPCVARRWGAVSLAYFCDGPCGMRGEPRGPASALPVGWVCVVVEGKMRHLCLACEKARRGEPK